LASKINWESLRRRRLTNGKTYQAEELLFEVGTHFGREHARNGERFQLHWKTHVEKSRQMIAKGAAAVSARDCVTILGAGSAYNIPLEVLARDFDIVRLVDIDRDGLARAVDELSADLRPKVDIHFADATAGLVVELLDMALDIVRRSEAAEEAIAQLTPLFKGGAENTTHVPSAPDGWKASYVVSSGLSSQATILPERAVIKAYSEKFGVEIEPGYFFKRGSFQLRNDWVRRHGELLASLVLPGGRVYWADTVAETPCLSEHGDGPLNAMVGSVVRFLEQAYLNTFLTESGKTALAQRYTGSQTSSPDQGDQLIRSFKSKLDNDGKRRLAWAIMTLTGESLIAPNKELELLEFVLREAERMSPVALQAILNGRLSNYFPAGLEPEGEMASWRWINDPEATVTLNGGAFYVDAQILKPTTRFAG
jgi:hypothetical protein